VTRSRVVFIGGYFYDPFFGPYPWWMRGEYPYPYFPMYQARTELHVKATPKDAMVYVDGFYAGIVDDFDGVFQRLPLPPGSHEITLYHEGYRTFHQNMYLLPGSSVSLRHSMEALPEGVSSEPPVTRPPVPPPPPGTYLPPYTPSNSEAPLPQSPERPGGTGVVGTLTLEIQPTGADVSIDGQRWVSSDARHFLLQLAPGRHRVNVTKTGYQRFSADVIVNDGQATPLNVILLVEAQ
jgi:hypothetical protein